MTAPIINVVAIILTLMVFSRVAGDNPLFRLAQYLFVGVSLGLAFVVAFQQVLSPAAVALASGTTEAWVLYGTPLVLGVLLLPRIGSRQRLSWLANIPLSLIFGVGAALAIGGAIAGTLIPQILDTNRPLTGDLSQIIGTIVLAAGTVITLGAFYYTAPREGSRGRLIRATATIGHWLLMVAFGFFFASAVQTYMAALTERLQFIISWLGNLVG